LNLSASPAVFNEIRSVAFRPPLTVRLAFFEMLIKLISDNIHAVKEKTVFNDFFLIENCSYCGEQDGGFIPERRFSFLR